MPYRMLWKIQLGALESLFITCFPYKDLLENSFETVDHKGKLIIQGILFGQTPFFKKETFTLFLPYTAHET